ncbi:rCG29970, isoform CRA_b [Rattus norvegicus]|uniref:RCG29970, isoform CRA_b n=1 Tax=Rattus norvegicus TaxID=10116 RepID=A6IM83_RAT|nr:rCG29970, isoform CRA_b [Rattus norvegicus]
MTYFREFSKLKSCQLLFLFFSSLNLKKYNEKYGGCMFLSQTRLENAMCMNRYPCICQKRLDNFPD